MKVIKTIRDTDFALDIPAPEKYEEKRSVRVIVFNKNKEILVLHSTVKNYHTIPGGGVEEGEEIVDAAKREVLEEAGCQITNIRELGSVEEYRNKVNRHQFTYYFLAELDGEIGATNLQDDEIEEGLEIIPMDINTCLKTIENELNDHEGYVGKFTSLRSVIALKVAKQVLGL